MANVTLFNGANVPAFAKNAAVSAMTQALTGGGAQGRRISIRGGVFRLVDAGKEVAAIEERYLDVVVVAAAPKVARSLTLAKWDPENPSAPDCWSADGDTPDKDVPSPQARRCSECPQNIAGSGNGDSRACRFSQNLAVQLATDIEGPVHKLQVPATSIFGKAEGDNTPLQAYARSLAARNVDIGMVVTRLKFDTTVESPKLFFKAMRWLTDEEYAIAQEQGASQEAQDAISTKVAAPSVTTTQPALEGRPPARVAAAVPDVEDDEAPAPAPTPAPAPAARTRKPKPAVVEASAEDDEAPAPTPAPKRAAPAAAVEDPTAEPVVRNARAAAPAPAQSNLASMIDEWDDE